MAPVPFSYTDDDHDDDDDDDDDDNDNDNSSKQLLKRGTTWTKETERLSDRPSYCGKL